MKELYSTGCGKHDLETTKKHIVAFSFRKLIK